MAQAGAMAEIISGLATQNWYFLSGSFGDVVSTPPLEISGSWTRTSATSNTISWNGTDPSFTASASVSPAQIAIGTDAGATTIEFEDTLCIIPHTAVPLVDGDTIVYTSIEISFTTDDVVS